jgi:hypothetical protein
MTANAAGNAGWRFRFRFAAHVIWFRVPEIGSLGAHQFMVCGVRKRSRAS